MNKKIWIHKFNSFDEAEAFDKECYFKMTPVERLDVMQYLREMFFKFNPSKKKKREENESRKGLRRVIKVVQ